jgi:hypothetical protein
MSDVTGFEEFIADKAAEWTRRGVITRTPRLTRKRAEAHLNELCADAFATYYMGPSYPCAAIHLRLSPGPTVDDDDHPSDLKRAYVILRMLHRMNDDAGDPPVYKPVLEELEREWELAGARAGATALDGATTERLDKFIADVWDTFGLRLIASALYPTSGGGWNIAESWMREWNAKYGRETLAIPSSIPPNGKLRDALNAAWTFRLFHQEPEAVVEITKAALDLCQRIVDAEGSSQSPAPPITPGGS